MNEHIVKVEIKAENLLGFSENKSNSGKHWFEKELFAFQPNDHGQLSFFVMATDEEEAKKAVEDYIKNNRLDKYDYQGWGTDYYTLTVLQAGEVIANEND